MAGNGWTVQSAEVTLRVWRETFLIYLPPALHEGMFRYLESGVIPGSFLQAVLRNDLMDAALRADDMNALELASIAKFVTFYMPPASFGSEAAMTSWRDGGGLRGRE